MIDHLSKMRLRLLAFVISMTLEIGSSAESWTWLRSRRTVATDETRHKTRRNLWEWVRNLALSEEETQYNLFQRHFEPYPQKNVSLAPINVPTVAPKTPSPTPQGSAPSLPATSQPTHPPLNTPVSGLPTSPTTFTPTSSSVTPTTSPTIINEPSMKPTLSPSNITNESVEEFLARTLTDDGSLQTTGTPQNDALLALDTQFPDLSPSNGTTDQLQITQIYSLLTLFYSTNGNGWASRAGWESVTLPCNDAPWFGVLCADNVTVTELNLTSNDLLGTIPSEIRGLSTLGRFRIACMYSMLYYHSTMI